ncbi:hypothetical protein ACJMK2_024324, partial [Sinanodonta woodiana]
SWDPSDHLHWSRAAIPDRSKFNRKSHHLDCFLELSLKEIKRMQPQQSKKQYQFMPHSHLSLAR